MGSAGVQQLAALRDLFQRALDWSRPESLAVLGVAGGNGLDRIDCSLTKRIVGVDINQQYLDHVRQRFGHLDGLELSCADLGGRGFHLKPVTLAHAALIFEHTGLGVALENALSILSPSGVFSVVLQLPSTQEAGVSATQYASMQTLKDEFTLIDVGGFRRLLEEKGFRLADEHTLALPGGKAFWHGLFTRAGDARA